MTAEDYIKKMLGDTLVQLAIAQATIDRLRKELAAKEANNG